ncbi:ferredoxin reductase [Hydrocarboniphaga effusa]|uniref:ferredoxin reductase n=1 Tax=Hydrocarboniphaga effusa TaxID=243629 RepID=UPI00398BD626
MSALSKLASQPSGIWMRGLDRLLKSEVAATLTAPHGVERFIEQWNPLWSVDQVKARIVGVQRPTEDAVVLRLRPNRHWTGFRAGQYVRVGVEVDGVRLMRCYSLSEAPGSADGCLEIAVRRQGRVSNWLFERAQIGQVLMLSQADGDFVLPEIESPLLLIAGGSGITPVLSLLRSLLSRHRSEPVALLYYVRNREQGLFVQELQRIAELRPQWTIRIVETRTGTASRHFEDAQLRALGDEFAQATTYVCGPAALIDAVELAMREQGRAERLRYERFVAAIKPAAAPGSANGDLIFSRSERYVANDGRSLLDQAEAAGLRPDAGCRMGICHSCLCRKTSGRVRDLRNGTLSDEGEQDIQLCVSAAVGDVTLDL